MGIFYFSSLVSLLGFFILALIKLFTVTNVSHHYVLPVLECRAVQCSTVQCCTMQGSTLHFCIMQGRTAVLYSAVLYSAVLYSAVLYNAVMYNAVLYSAVQYRKVHSTALKCAGGWYYDPLSNDSDHREAQIRTPPYWNRQSLTPRLGTRWN